MSLSKRYWIGAAILACALATTACSSSASDDADTSSGRIASTGNTNTLGVNKPASGTPVKIGFVNLEGGAALSLPDIRKAAEAVAKYANAHLGGIGGHPVQLDVCNDVADGASLLACGNRFVQDKVVAVVEGLVSSES